MITTTQARQQIASAAIAIVLSAVGAALAGCAANSPPPPEAAAVPPAPPPPPPPPPVDLAGRWRLTAVGAGACFMKFGADPGAIEGTIAPEGGCPAKFFTSRKWTYEHGQLIIHDHKGETLVQLSFSDGHFEGHVANIALSLTR
jgi:hypothetical protein